MTEIATKRIPVTPETWAELHQMRNPGQTFDELLQDLIKAKQELNLLKDLADLEKNGEFVDLETAKKELNLP